METFKQVSHCVVDSRLLAMVYLAAWLWLLLTGFFELQANTKNDAFLYTACIQKENNQKPASIMMGALSLEAAQLFQSDHQQQDPCLSTIERQLMHQSCCWLCLLFATGQRQDPQSGHK